MRVFVKISVLRGEFESDEHPINLLRSDSGDGPSEFWEHRKENKMVDSADNSVLAVKDHRIWETTK